MLITHPDDSDLAKLKVSDTFSRFEPICREGKDGATAYHFHISGGKGKLSGNGWKQNTKGKWVLTTTGGAQKPENLFYLDPDFTGVISDAGISFAHIPATYSPGYYKVKTSVLNVRVSPGTNSKKAATVLKGKQLKVTQTKGNWGKIGENRWICLDYCEVIK